MMHEGGERRVHRSQRGAHLRRTKPRPFSIRKGGLGAWLVCSGDRRGTMHPIGAYTANKQRVYVDALSRVQCRFDLERDPATQQVVAFHCTCGLDTTDPAEALRHAKTARPNSWSLCFIGRPQ